MAGIWKLVMARRDAEPCSTVGGNIGQGYLTLKIGNTYDASQTQVVHSYKRWRRLWRGPLGQTVEFRQQGEDKA